MTKPQFDWQAAKTVAGLFNCELLFDYIRYFVLFEKRRQTAIKKIAAYHQFHAVREAAVTATIVASTGKHLPLHKSNIQPGSKKAGVFRHTCGSAKAFHVPAGRKLPQQAEMNNPTIVVVTDRNDPDGQGAAHATFCQKYGFPQTPAALPRRASRLMPVNWRQLLTTVQKFAPLR